MTRTKVVCELCGQEISKSNYTKHLKRHKEHPETFKDYSWKLTHDGLTCQYCGKEYKNRNSLCNHERLCPKNPQRSEYIHEGFNNVGHIAWNKGLTKETDIRVRKNAESVKKTWESGLIQYNNRITPEIRNKISNTCLEKSRKGEWHTSLARNMHHEYKGFDLHGTWELKYAMYLDEQGINWYRNKERFEYLYEGKLHYYTPDFYLPDSDEYVEIKGYIRPGGKDYAKWRCFPSEKSLVILKEKDLRNLGIII